MKKLHIGDKVKMNNKYYIAEQNKDKIFTVASNPKQVGGTLCVWLENYRGCYAADGLDIQNNRK